MKGLEDDPLSEDKEMGDDGAGNYITCEKWDVDFESLTTNDVMQLQFSDP